MTDKPKINLIQQDTTVLADLYKMVKDRIEEVGGCDDLLPVLDYIKSLAPKERQMIKKAFRAGVVHANEDWHDQLYLSLSYRKFA